MRFNSHNASSSKKHYRSEQEAAIRQLDCKLNLLYVSPLATHNNGDSSKSSAWVYEVHI